MKKYRYALSVTSQFYFCGVPFRLDTSPKCSFNCLYCFAMSRGGRRTSQNQIADVDQITHKLQRAMSEDHDKLDINGEMLAHRVPVHFGGISDPFSNRSTTRVSKELLRMLGKVHYPVIVSTKNATELMKRDTLELLRNACVAVQISVSTSRGELARVIEPRAPSIRERLKCFSILSSEGIPVFARLQPLFLPWIEEIIGNLIPQLARANCKHVMVEFLKLPVERNVSMVGDLIEAIGWDAYKDYKKNGASLVGREWILPAEFKWERLQPVIKAIHSYDMTYGAADYGLNHLGDTDCCCGINTLPGFEGWFRGNFSNVIRNCESQSVSFKEVCQYWIPRKSISMYINSHCRLTEGNAMIDYQRDKWNRPGTPNAPDSFLGVSWLGDYDQEGYCLYSKSEVNHG
jgi:DNA repair photolyase